MNHIKWKFAASSFLPYKHFLLRSSFCPPKSQSHPQSCLSLSIVSCTKFFRFFLRLFSILSHSFVTIELINFFENAKFHFYCSRELSVFGLENKSVRKQDWFFAFWVYKNVSQSNCFFVYEWKWQWLPSVKYNVHILYKQTAKKVQNNFIYKNIDTLHKSKTIYANF